MATFTICSDFGAHENKSLSLFPMFPHLFAMKWRDQMPWSWLFECWVLSQLCHAKIGTIKDRNGKDLTEAEEINRRWQEYTEELFNTGLNNLDNHSPIADILQCEVKWALGSITMNKASGGDGTQVELFQILKDDAVKELHSVCQ